RASCRPPAAAWLMPPYDGPSPQIQIADALGRLQIAVAGLAHDVTGQIRPRCLLVPGLVLQAVAHPLFVERGHRASRTSLGSLPETRGVGREGFVDQRQAIV